MLHDLLRVDLSSFDPRRVPMTAGLRAQQEQSLPPEPEWVLEAVETGELVTTKKNGGFGQTVKAADLHKAYTEHCKRQGRRPMAYTPFGRWLGRVGLVGRLVTAARVKAWDVPDAATLEAMVRKAAGLR